MNNSHQLNIGNSHRNGNIVCDLVRYRDFETNEFLREVASGTTQTEAIGALWQLIINPTAGKLISSEQLSDRSCEFPLVKSSQVGQEWRYTYLAVHKPNAVLSRELVGTIGRFDRHTNTLTTADLASHLYPTEPIHVVDKFDANRGWILTALIPQVRTKNPVFLKNGKF